jgi:DNA-binding MarR family transcriptional regulator
MRNRAVSILRGASAGAGFLLFRSGLVRTQDIFFLQHPARGTEAQMPEKEAQGPYRQMFDRDEERRWREERRAGEEQRLREERRWLEKPTIVGLRATELRKAEWLEAMRWRRRVESTCAVSGLSFAQWLLLHSAQRLIEETEDAVIQAQIAARVELDQTTVSQMVRRLEGRGLVSRGGDMTGKAWRVYLTDAARRLLRDLDDPIEATSGATTGARGR